MMQTQYANAFPMPSAEANWAERHGALILSLCAHVVLFAWLVSSIDRPAPPPEPPRSIKVVMRQTAPPPVPSARAETERPDAARENVSQQETLEAALPREPSPRPPTENPLADPEPKPVRDTLAAEAEIPKAEESKIQEILRTYSAEAPEVRKEVHEERAELESRLEKMEMAAAGFDAFPDFEGARVGTIRILKMGAVPREIQEKIKTRYGIRVFRRYLEGVKTRSFLNAVSTEDGLYASDGTKPGYYEVFSLPPKAVSKMAALEEQWLESHGYDPKTTRVDSVEFGIVQRDDGTWDLGILDIEIQPFSQVGRSTGLDG